MSWLVGNANTIYLLLGITAAGLVIVWRFDRRVKFLGYAACVLVLIAVIWLMCQVIPSDRKQLEDNVHAMADAVVAGKMDDLFKHISNDFRYKEMTRDILYTKTQAAVRVYKIRDVRITKFEVDELSRDKKFAKTTFNVSAWEGDNDFPYMFVTQADFVLEGEEWKLKTLRFKKRLVDQDQDLDLPFP
jgi:hypothetical protein